MYYTFKWSYASIQRNNVHRIYEPIQPFILMAAAEHMGAEVFIDVGANIGTYSIVMSSVESVKRIYSFEPNPSSFQELILNIKNNNLEGVVHALDVAASGVNEQLTFGVISDYSGANSVISSSIHEEGKFPSRISVQGRRIDDVIDYKEKVICMKVDVEGHESEVLSGALGVLSNNTVFVQIEGYTSEAFSEIFCSLGYRRIFRAGADFYYTNSDKFDDPDALLRLLEVSVENSISENFDKPPRYMSPFFLKIFPGVSLRISGRAASFLRGALGRPDK